MGKPQQAGVGGAVKSETKKCKFTLSSWKMTTVLQTMLGRTHPQVRVSSTALTKASLPDSRQPISMQQLGQLPGTQRSEGVATVQHISAGNSRARHPEQQQQQRQQHPAGELHQESAPMHMPFAQPMQQDRQQVGAFAQPPLPPQHWQLAQGGGSHVPEPAYQAVAQNPTSTRQLGSSDFGAGVQPGVRGGSKLELQPIQGTYTSQNDQMPTFAGPIA
jgi:hypothetical protein